MNIHIPFLFGHDIQIEQLPLTFYPPFKRGLPPHAFHSFPILSIFNLYITLIDRKKKHTLDKFISKTYNIKR